MDRYIEKPMWKLVVVLILIIFGLVGFGYLIRSYVSEKENVVGIVWNPRDFSNEIKVEYHDTGMQIVDNTNSKIRAEATAIHIDMRKFCPVCQEKGLKSRIYEGSSSCTLVYSQPWYDEDGNYHYVNINTSTTYYSCSKGHEWYEACCMGEMRIEIIKDTENEIIKLEESDADEYIIDIGEEPGYWFVKPEDTDEFLGETESITFGIEGDVVISLIPPTSVIFGGDIGKISWENGIMIFEGEAEESAKLFFEGCLKPIIDEYIKSKIEKEEEIGLTFEVSEDIMYCFTTTFDAQFQPVWFLKVVNTDMSNCFQDGRLRLNLNGEIYWMRLEKDE